MRILVVDDDACVARSIKRALRSSGWDVFTAHDGETALALLADGPMDVLLCDHLLPGMHGVELAREAIRVQPGLSIVITSGGATSDPVRKAIEDGVVKSFLPKPWRRHTLVRALAEAGGVAVAPHGKG